MILSLYALRHWVRDGLRRCCLNRPSGVRLQAGLDPRNDERGPASCLLRRDDVVVGHLDPFRLLAAGPALDDLDLPSRTVRRAPSANRRRRRAELPNTLKNYDRYEESMNQWSHLGVANSTGRTRLRAVSVRHAIFTGTETMAVHGEGARPVGPGPAGTARFRSPGEWLVEAFIRPVFERVESPRNSARFTGVCRTQAERHRQVDPNVAVHASVSGARVSRRVPCRRRLGDSLLDLRARCELRRLMQVLGRRNRPWPGGDRDDRGLEVAERFPRARNPQASSFA